MLIQACVESVFLLENCGMSCSLKRKEETVGSDKESVCSSQMKEMRRCAKCLYVMY